MLIRPESGENFADIDVLLSEAFGSDYEPTLVRDIRRTDDYIPELTMVAEGQSGVVGFAMLSRVQIGKDIGLALGPVAVAPAVQKTGIGTKLVSSALSVGDGTIYDTSVVLGDPDYYRRFGYSSASECDIYPPVPWSDEHFMVRRAASSSVRGMVLYPPAWRISAGDLQTVNLRSATVEDAAAIARVFKISFRTALPYLAILHSAQEDLDFFKRELSSSNLEVVVAETAECIVGFIAIDVVRRFIDHLYVLPIAHSHGVGARLLNFAKHRHSPLSLWAFQKNSSALAFYQKHGFVPVKWTDGAENEEREPDVLFEWSG